jgi:Ca-activated chloride channel family protein
MTAFHFLRPGWFLVLPPLLALLLWAWRKQLRSRSWQQVCDPHLLPHLLLGRSRRRANWPLWLLLPGALLAVTALAGPAWHRQPQPLFRQQSALVILLDLSRSMAAADLKPNRLQRARLKVEDLLNLRREGQTALIAFAGDAFAVTPLTDDRNTIRALLQSLDPDLMPVQGSEPQRAIELGLQLLQQAGLKRGRLLLITDEDRPERSMDAARRLSQQGGELAVLGIGTVEGAPIPLAGGGFFKDDRGDLVLPGLDEPGLRRLAAAGGGSYRRLSIDDGDLRGLLAGLENHRLDQAEQAAGKTGQRWREEGVWLLWPLILLAALAFRRGWLLLVALILLQPVPARAFSWHDLWQRPDQQAARAFAEGDFEEAGRRFQDPRWRAGALYRAGDYQAAARTLQKPESADDWYNRGNALARSGQLPQALEAYGQALQINPDHADARANKQVVEEVLRQQQEQQQSENRSEEGQQGQNSPDSKESPSPQKPGGDGSQPQADHSPADPGRDAKNPAGGDQKPEQAAQNSAPGSAETKDSNGERKATQEPEGAISPVDDEQDAARNAAPATASENDLSAEEQRAARQWLQQIPDDPGGLLRRKFLYQYRQRGRQLETDRPW